jgi:hypothetical protein
MVTGSLQGGMCDIEKTGKPSVRYTADDVEVYIIVMKGGVIIRRHYGQLAERQWAALLCLCC